MSDQSMKKDAGKPRFELVPLWALEPIAAVLTFGAAKYAPWGWTRGMEWSRLIGAAKRHLAAWEAGEEIDPESGLSHLGHLGCCVLFLMAYSIRNLGTDDRHKWNADK